MYSVIEFAVGEVFHLPARAIFHNIGIGHRAPLTFKVLICISSKLVVNDKIYWFGGLLCSVSLRTWKMDKIASSSSLGKRIFLHFQSMTQESHSQAGLARSEVLNMCSFKWFQTSFLSKYLWKSAHQPKMRYSTRLWVIWSRSSLQTLHLNFLNFLSPKLTSCFSGRR